MFRGEDSDSILARKRGIKNFLEAVSQHSGLSLDESENKDEIKPFESFLWARSTREFEDYKNYLRKVKDERSILVNGPTPTWAQYLPLKEDSSVLSVSGALSTI
jgi:hypothetical protein